MAIPAEIQALATKVRNEVYGRDVREAIAKSIEETGKTAAEAYEITQNLIDGTFDEGILSTQIEQKLLDLEAQYAPQLTSLTAELAEIAKLPQNYSNGSETDDTGRINRALEGGGRIRIPYRITPYIISSTLLIESDTTIEIDEGVTIYLANGSNCRMVENKNKSSKTNLTRQNNNIVILGGIWDANSANNPTKWLADGGTATAFFFSGVDGLTFKPKLVKNAQTYAFWACNVKDLIAEDGEVYQGDVYLSGTNRDGIHVQGPSENISIKNWKIRSFDDCVAINADDVEQGDFATNGAVKNVNIENIEMNDCKTGIRLMSVTSRVDNLSIKNIYGTTRSFAVEIGSYALGASDFGFLSLEKINVQITPGEPKSSRLIHVNGLIEMLKIKDFKIPDDYSEVFSNGIVIGQDNNGFPTGIDVLEIDGLIINKTSEDSARYVLVTSEVTIGTLSIKNARALNTTSINGTFPIVIGGDIERLMISDSYFEKTNQGVFLIDGSTIGSIDYRNITLKNTVNPIPKVIYWSNSVIGTVTISDFQGRPEMKNLTRDLTLQGTQTVTGLKGLPKSIRIKSIVVDTNKMSDGTWDGVYQESIYSNNLGNFKDGTYWAIVMEDSLGNHTLGTISNVSYGQFDIVWTKGGTGATGTAFLKIEVTY